MTGVRNAIVSVGFLAVTALAAPMGFAQAPGEVTDVEFMDPTTLSWQAASGAATYNVYRGKISDLKSGVPGQCHGWQVPSSPFTTTPLPASGEGYFFLVTGRASSGEEGTAGIDSVGAPRPLLGSCDSIMEHHVLDRVAHCTREWDRERIDVLGLQGYIDEQLDPESIPDEINTDIYLTRLPAVDPPTSITDIISQAVIRGMYSWRQLEQVTTTFLVNHFNTNYSEIRPYFQGRGLYTNEEINQLTVDTQYLEMQDFRDRAFNGTFHDLAVASVTGPAMILYLDNDENVAGRPQENLARELLELHTMGVDRGYTQTDVEEMARILTGWNICKKRHIDLHNKIGYCLPLSLEATQDGRYVSNFRPAQHDCGAKTLFAGTPYETNIPDTCASPNDGVNDIDLALDAVISHPSTPEFIVTKLIKWFVTEEPTQAMIDEVVLAWNDAGNPQGVGDFREVLRAVVGLEAFLDPDYVGSKIMTPLEHVICTLRATRGLTNGSSGVQSYLTRMSHRPHLNPVPTGYPESGDAWIDTNNYLERQNWALDLTARTNFNYGTALTNLLADNGLDAASPPGEIVDFWAEILYGGALTSAERQAAVDYLTTDDSGNPASPTDARIRETVGFMMGFARYLEQ